MDRLDRLAYLGNTGMHVVPLNPEQLAWPERDLLIDWAEYWFERRRKAMKDATKGAAKK